MHGSKLFITKKIVISIGPEINLNNVLLNVIQKQIISNRKGGVIMAAKTANILARVEPEIKEKAEAIMSKLGIPASVVINMLYKQIIITKSIPFSLSLPTTPMARDEIDNDTFKTIMQNGLDEAKSDLSREASKVFVDLKRGL